MRTSNQGRRVITAMALSAVMLSAGNAFAQSTYFGNGNTGFGGPVGTGSLTISNGADASGNPNVTFSFMGGSIHPTLDGNDLVLYLSTGAAGLSNTSTLDDNEDGGREAVSGANNANGTRTLVTFPAGFQATYAVSIQDSFIGLFHLVSLNAPPALDYVGAGTSPGVTYSSDGGNAPFVDTITVPLSVIGVTPGQGFQFVGTDIAEQTYRSNEAFGLSDAPPGGNNANIGNTGTLDFLGADAFSTTAPEPSTASLLMLSGLACLGRRRRRQPFLVSSIPVA